MHLLPSDGRSLDADAVAQDLGQSAADLVVLSFSDGDLAAVAAVHAGNTLYPTLRLANLSRLKHPYSVDLYLDTVATRARFVLVRILGGLDYWRYGVDELAALARRTGLDLAVIPGCEREDLRLDQASTLPPEDLRRLWAWFREGGPDNLAQMLRYAGSRLGRPLPWAEPRPLPAAGLHRPFCHAGNAARPHATVLFYRSALLAADTAPVAGLAEALRERGFRVSALHVTALKDEAAARVVAGQLAADPPDVILNLTAFSARRDTGPSVLDHANVPVLQVVQAGVTRAAWAESSRGLGATDLAMNVVLPETDGRVLAGAISFKGEGSRHEAFEHAPVSHRPEASRIGHVADLALAWARLRRTPRSERRMACVLSDYPGKGGRGGYAVGLDTPASLIGIAEHLGQAGFSIPQLPETAGLMARLTAGPLVSTIGLAEYRCGLERLPTGFIQALLAAWGEPEQDEAVADGAFQFRVLRAGHLVVAIQPDRGRRADRRADYHDAGLPPRHAYVAFYMWLRETERIDALIHLGTHGTLEWLPGKALALSPECSPEIVLGPVPVIYPFIVNNPGEAAQAKRRIAAVTLGHLTPPLIDAGSHGPMAELEALLEEYAEADGLDRRRAARLAQAILDLARRSGLADDCGLSPDEDPGLALGRLDAWLCDLKEARIGDGLHCYGQDGSDHASPELEGLVRALDGSFVPPGPSGSPARGRPDVLPTGRNLYPIDPRAVPTRTAFEIGRRAADELLTRYAQDHGDWLRRLVMDLWGSATMRTGGDELAQAFALMGVMPRWDDGSTRVNGFDILPLARIGRSRVDVTLRISGLFRDVFPEQIALFDAAARAVSELDEADEDNPLVQARRADPHAPFLRVFGAAPNQYGTGLADPLADGGWASPAELGEAYLAATSHAYAGRAAEAQPALAAFRDRVGAANAHLHTNDLPDADILSSDLHAEHQGGFAAAAGSLGAAPALYHGDGTRPDRVRIRSLPEGGGSDHAGSGRQPALDRGSDAAWVPGRRRDRRDPRQPLRLRGHHQGRAEPALRPDVRRHARQRCGARFPHDQQSLGRGAPWLTGSPMRATASSG